MVKQLLEILAVSIKGNKIDIFIPSKEEAINWGQKTVKIKILD